MSWPPAIQPPVLTTVASEVPVMPQSPMASVVWLPPGLVIAPMPSFIHTPRINVVPMPPVASPITAPCSLP
ncbi:rCG39594 [Rattus norvegicus]|uniref:RCG39594 n=1 Tax=Rattus norvegicus TaxID=10116 RepID=A6I5Z0_RAT|nr:rCG39594 [Rattus norvegicus]